MITAQVFEEAIEFAVLSHKGQTRKGDKRPYILHPLSVMNRIYGTKRSRNMYLLGAAAVLHDVVEDCGVKIETIAKMFGHAVASLVGELTLDKSKYASIGKKEYLSQHMNAMSSYALAIKLCDRLDNVLDLETMSAEFRAKYVAETQYILERLTCKLTTTHKKLIKQIQKVLKGYEAKTV